ncbi:MAG: PAS domain S-box protein [Bacteroidales bacterium]|nr:PAS domain S-box protein [Bacteroidales bacterium]
MDHLSKYKKLKEKFNSLLIDKKIDSELITEFEALIQESEKRINETQLNIKSNEDLQKFEMLVKNIADTIVILDENSLQQYISPSVEKITGFKSEELVGRPLNELIHPDDFMSLVEKIIFLHQNPDSIVTSIYRHVHKTKEWVYLEANGQNFLKNPALKCLVIIVRDITQRVKMENELIKLNADKDRFLQIVAHDLRSPFNTLLGYSEILLNKVDILEKTKIKEIAKNINEASNSGYKLLQNLLLWSKSQSGKLPFLPSKLNFESATLEVISLMESQATSKNISIKFLEVKNVFLKADKEMFSIIMRNLISNAIKFTHKKGTIIISTEITEKEAIISISDNGLGISKEKQEKLWNCSNPVSTPGTDNEKGSGIGLLLCKDFVEKHGGKIWAESKLKEGSRFIFTMPLS